MTKWFAFHLKFFIKIYFCERRELLNGLISLQSARNRVFMQINRSHTIRFNGDKMKEKIVDFSWENTQQSYTTTMHTTTAQQENSLYSPSPQHLNPLLLDPPLLQNLDPPPLLILDPPLTLWKLLECQVSGRLDPDHLNVWNLVHLNVCSCGLGHKRVCCHC